jgi:hypothetical protein
MPVISSNTSARAEGYFRLEWKLAVDRSHLMADERKFILPVVIDETRDRDALVPDKFRDVQWTHAAEGRVTPELVARVQHYCCRARWVAAALAALIVVGSVIAYLTHFRSSALETLAVLEFTSPTESI